MIGSNLSLYQMEPRQSRRDSHAPKRTPIKPKRPEGRKFRQYVAALSGKWKSAFLILATGLTGVRQDSLWNVGATYRNQLDLRLRFSFEVCTSIHIIHRYVNYFEAVVKE